MANILFISHRIPFPPNKGDKIRSYNILQNLIRKHTVDAGFVIDDVADVANVKYVSSMAKRVAYDVVRFPVLRKVRSFCLAVISGTSITNKFFYSPKLQKQFDSWIDENVFDYIFCFSSPSAEYIFRSKHYNLLKNKVNLIMDFVDVDSVKWRQYSESSTLLMKLIYRYEAATLLQFEKRIAREFDHLLLVSEAEKDLFLRYVQTDNVHAMSNGVNLEEFSPPSVRQISGNQKKIVFVGVMDYLPNIDAVIWFVTRVFPEIRREFEKVQFYIVGSNPSEKVRSLAVQDQIVVTGFVEDVRSYIDSADLCVVPLMVARGIQNKVMEAMAMGKALVCTPQALEGIDAEPGEEVLTAQTEDAFVQAVTTLLNDDQRRDKMGKRARACMEKKYAWESHLARLDRIMENSN